MKKIMMAALAVAVAAFATGVSSVPVQKVAAPVTLGGDMAAPRRSALSVMTYNVEGLPWPIVSGRPAALAQIAHRLAALRQSGRQPDVVLLQEAFIPQAKAIGSLAGYRYVTFGPGTADASAHPAATLGAGFDGQARWSKGEGDGKWVDSGLAILSDYPIVSTARMAFPQDACAGYDCLAAKGALLARIAVPGLTRPVVIVDTHLNSRTATGVSVYRANTAYAWQAAALKSFVARNVSKADDAIVGGDFNLGRDPARLEAVNAQGGVLEGASEAVASQMERMARSGALDTDMAAVDHRAKDKEYFRPGNGGRLRLGDVSVPFGIAEGGFGLSDHLGFVADYHLE